MAETGIIAVMTNVFDGVFTWLSNALTTVLGVFYTAEGGLTVLGTLAIIGLAISIFLLIVNIVSNFFNLRS